MRADAVEAERRFRVREAARAWERAGAIDAATRARIDALYPDDRSRLGPVFRLLVFGFTIVVANAIFGIVGLAIASVGARAAAVVLITFGLLLAAATELQVGRLRRTQGGTEAATALLSACYLTGGLLSMLAPDLHDDATINLILLLIVLVFGLAAYRWGYTAFAVVAAVAVFVLVARSDVGRLAWIAVPVVAIPLLLRAGDMAALAPAHRRSLQAMAVVAIVFLYAGIHVGSWDAGIVERINGTAPSAQREHAARPFFVLATALVPAIVVGGGVVARRRLLLGAGLALVLASLVTLRAYVHVAPLWVALTAGGVVAFALAVVLRRFLDSGPGRERRGLTAEPLFTDPEKRSTLEAAASVLVLSPDARRVDDPSYAGGGGRSGGGGATDSF
jgi:hypothetical protein